MGSAWLRTYLYWITGVALGTALLWLFRPLEAGSPEEREAIKAGRTVITYWDRHSGHEHEARLALFQEYNNTQGRKTYLVNAANWNAVQAELVNYSGSALDAIASGLASGSEFVLPQDGRQVILDFIGSGYIFFQFF